jgi:hypothetical protein
MMSMCLIVRVKRKYNKEMFISRKTNFKPIKANQNIEKKLNIIIKIKTKLKKARRSNQIRDITVIRMMVVTSTRFRKERKGIKDKSQNILILFKNKSKKQK